MPTNKNASFRYRVINECLRNTARRWTLEDLIEEISEQLSENFFIDKGISKRTVQNDIAIMRSYPPRGFDAPIKCTEGNYYYEDPEYSIDNNPLNKTDLENLNNAVAILNQFKGLPVASELQQAVNKLERTITANEYKSDILQIESKENVKGTEFIKPLFEFIQEKIVVKITYQPYTSDKAYDQIVHPYLIKEYNNRWFLFGLNTEFGNIGNYALDRIHLLEATDEKYKESTNLDPDTYFNSIIGVTIPNNAEVQEIELLFSKSRAPYIKTKPIHQSMEVISEDENGLHIRLRLIINKELVTEILNYGDDVKVLKPDELVEQVVEKLGNALGQY